MSDDLWGPWIDHDGKGCPCRGSYVQILNDTGGVWEGVARSQGNGSAISWDQRYKYIANQVVKYRIRKPKGMKILESLLENLPEEIEA